MPSTTITTLTVPSYPYVGGEFLVLTQEFHDNPDFRQSVTYERFSLSNDPITGDLNKSTSNTYTIYADVQIMEISNKLVEAGLLEVGDAEIYLPSRIQKDTSGTAIDYEFRPQIKDEITHAGVTYNISSVEFVRYGETEIFARCRAKRRKDTNPDTIWNPNYSNTYDIGGGYT